MTSPSKRLQDWEYAQINDWVLLDADPSKGEVQAAAHLLHDSPEEGLERLLSLARGGSLYCMTRVAWCYAAGKGVTEDWDQAQTWYRRAYEGGSDRALLDYGGRLESKGRVDETRAVYETGRHRGFIPAVYRLIRIGLTPTLSPVQRLAWKPLLEEAAAAGHPAAQFMLTKYLIRGWFGVREIPRGVTLFCGLVAAIRRGNENRAIAA